MKLFWYSSWFWENIWLELKNEGMFVRQILSSHTDCMHSSDSLSISLSIGLFHQWYFLLTASSFHARLTNIRLCWWAKREMSMCKNPRENSAYEQILFGLLGWFVRWEACHSIETVLWGAASRICWKRHTASLRIFHQAFSSSALLKSLWCNG